MAIYVTITDTNKEGWISVNTNQLYLAGLTTFKEIDIKKNTVERVNIINNGGYEGIDIYVMGKLTPYSVTNNIQETRLMPIESVNGASPVDLQDLKNKIMSLL